MFDASIFELLIVCVVALLVLGPERLPGAVRTIGLWVGRLRRSFNNIKRDIEKEIGADDIRRQLRNEAIMEKFDSGKKQFTNTIDSIKKETATIKSDLNFESEVSGFMGAGKSKDKDSPKTDSANPAKESVDSLTTSSSSNSPEASASPAETPIVNDSKSADSNNSSSTTEDNK